MKLLVMSDSHGDDEIVTELISNYQSEVDGIFHCGDSEFSKDNPLVDRLNLVKGNMDFEDFPPSIIQTIDNNRILMTHGHLQNVNNSMLNLTLFGKENQADIVLFGHTHQAYCEMYQGMLIVNPGSISQPRGQFAQYGGLYCIIDKRSDSYQIQYYNRQFEPISSLSFTEKVNGG
ncbi:metallophosphoesterase [Lentilactobacillus sp. Marseille-Q4993]|uniref:metallophosphoesterase n=1 Tax=Lentilactobacillus sp. Marseille-Q4993 TaxID=3039492 RepID=UPI0024BC09B2|nr:metallophosphoesterase [Lentilactobacillus sp. Marseille-Q4993]